MDHATLTNQIHALPTETWKAQVDEFYSHFSLKDSILVTIDPDPDAIASALAVKRLLWHKSASTSIGIIRSIRRLNNLAMVRLLKLPLIPMDKLEGMGKFDKYVLVDAQPGHNEAFTNFHYTAVIDHHPRNATADSDFFDIRPEYGSTSTIMTQYLRAAGIKPSQALATTLLYGIKTDTRNFERHTLVEDIEAFKYLFEYADHNILRKIEVSDLSLGDTRFFYKAFARKHVVRDRIFAHLDEVTSSDILVEVAEFLLKIHDISWSIVSGIYGDHLIIVVRNDGNRKDAGKLVRRVFASMGCAGGHQAMARVEIDLKSLAEVIGNLSSASIERYVRRSLSPFKKH